LRRCRAGGAHSTAKLPMLVSTVTTGASIAATRTRRAQQHYGRGTRGAGEGRRRCVLRVRRADSQLTTTA
jgi:hypothetical protein